MGKVRTDIVADRRVPLVVFDEFYRLRSVVDAPHGNRSVERIPLLLRDGLLLVPVAPDDNGFGVESREYGSFVIGEKTSELRLRPKRNAVTPVKVAVPMFRILVKVDLAPFLGREIAVKRLRFPILPQRHLGAEPDDSVAAGAAVAPIAEIPRHDPDRMQRLRRHGRKRPAAHRAADTVGCRPHEGNVRAQADRKHPVFSGGLDQGIAVEVAVTCGIAHPVTDLRDKRVTRVFDMAYPSVGSIYIRLRQMVYMVVKRIYRQQRFAAVTIFYFGLLHIADNESAAVFRPLHWLDNLFRIGSGGFGRNRIRLVLAGQPFGDHPHGAVHVREDVEQVGRLTVQLLQPSLQVGGILLTGRRGEAQQRPA